MNQQQDIPKEWLGFLKPDERILWQGAPQEVFYWRHHYWRYLFGSGTGLVFVFLFFGETATPMYWIIIFVLIISGIGPPIWDAIKRRYSFYTLTTERAFIGIDMPIKGRSLNSYPIDAKTELSMKKSLYDAVYFAHRMKETKNGAYRIDIGFESIEDGDKVYKLMSDIQRGEE